jgi:hypothetical protein
MARNAHYRTPRKRPVTLGSLSLAGAFSPADAVYPTDPVTILLSNFPPSPRLGATRILERASATRRRGGPASIVAYLGAAAFAAAAAWYTLAARAVTVAAAPRLGPHIPLLRREHIYYRWLVTTLPQERFYTAIAIAGFLCLAGVAAFALDWLGRDRIAARAGSFLAAAGTAAWIAGSLLQLGGHRAVGLMATHANPLQATNSIAFTTRTGRG